MLTFQGWFIWGCFQGQLFSAALYSKSALVCCISVSCITALNDICCGFVSIFSIHKQQSHPKNPNDKHRSKKCKEPKPRVKKLKYHQYIPPDQKGEKNEPQMDSNYARLLQQQQLFLQLQILSQQQQHYNYQTILPAPLKYVKHYLCPLKKRHIYQLYAWGFRSKRGLQTFKRQLEPRKTLNGIVHHCGYYLPYLTR